MKRKLFVLFVAFAVLSAFVIFFTNNTKRVEMKAVDILPWKLYQSQKAFAMTRDAETTKMAYGERTLGQLRIHGNILYQQETQNGITAFVVGQDQEVVFSYNDILNLVQGRAPEEWKIVNDSTRRIDNVVLDKAFDKGSIIIQKSDDGETWNQVVTWGTDLFTGQ